VTDPTPPQPTEPSEPLLKIPDAAALLGVSGWTVRNLLDDGTLPRIRIRRSVRIPRQAVLDYLAERTKAAYEEAAARRNAF
jgi:excisionase family DNA binding protein